VPAAATLESIEADVKVFVWRGNEARDEVRMRALREPGSVSYMGAFKLDGEGPYNFALEVQPFGATRSESIRFRQTVAPQ